MAKAVEMARGAGWSFWMVGGEVYRATTGSDMDTYGHPMGKRWECSVTHWERYRAVYSWAQDVGGA